MVSNSITKRVHPINNVIFVLKNFFVIIKYKIENGINPKLYIIWIK